MKRLLSLLFVLACISPAWGANDFYTHGGYPATGAPGSSAAARAEFDAIMAGFAKFPGLTGNNSKAVIVNSSGSALGVTTGTLTLDGNFTLSGAFPVTLTVSGPTSLTLPTSGQLVTTSSIIPATGGGTGLSSGTSGGILGFTSTTTIASSGLLTLNGLVIGGGAGATPSSIGAMTDGQIPIGRTGASPLPANIIATPNQTTITNGPGQITVGTVQNIHTSATPTFGGLTINGASSFVGNITQSSGTTTLGGTTISGALAASSTLVVTGGATFNSTVLLSGNPTLALQAAPKQYVDAQAKRVKVGTFSYDVSTASATQTISTVGFTPRLVLFEGTVDGVVGYSFYGGMDDGATRLCISFIDAASNFQKTFYSASLAFVGTAGNSATGTIQSFNAGTGFTISWTKTGSPTGTANIAYTAFE